MERKPWHGTSHACKIKMIRPRLCLRVMVFACTTTVRIRPHPAFSSCIRALLYRKSSRKWNSHLRFVLRFAFGFRVRHFLQEHGKLVASLAKRSTLVRVKYRVSFTVARFRKREHDHGCGAPARARIYPENRPWGTKRHLNREQRIFLKYARYRGISRAQPVLRRWKDCAIFFRVVRMTPNTV